MKAVKFFNSTKEDFEHKWDGEVYKFEKGTTTMLALPIALHFAKHLAVRELNRSNTITDSQHLPPLRDSFIIGTEIEEESEAKLEVKIMNEPKKKPAKKKAKKAAKKEVKEESAEEGFEGLKE